jgi:hypothetical protein
MAEADRVTRRSTSRIVKRDQLSWTRVTAGRLPITGDKIASATAVVKFLLGGRSAAPSMARRKLLEVNGA